MFVAGYINSTVDIICAAHLADPWYKEILEMSIIFLPYYCAIDMKRGFDFARSRVIELDRSFPARLRPRFY